MRHRLNTPAKLWVVCMCAAALWLGGLYWFTRHIDDGSIDEAHVTADAIVVLTGGSNRLQTGFDLLDKGLGKKLFISGVYHGVEVQELLAHRQSKDNATPNLDQSVVLGFRADDTVGNAHETAEWLEEQHYKSIYLVTANYHLKRALVEFRLIAPTIEIIPYPVTPEGLDMSNWWRNKTHRTLIIGEYCKYLFALTRSLIMGAFA